jgi:cobalt/nickel transport system permease protein
MHIPDGFLSNPMAISLNVVSAANVLYAARRTKIDLSGRMVPMMGMLAAFVFAAQMLNFPVLGGTSGHLIGGSLLSILLGPLAGSLAVTTVIVAQALFLQDGGLVALGANIFNISIVTCMSGYAIFRLLGGNAGGGKRLFLAGFLAGWFSTVISAAFCALELGLSGAIPLRIGLMTMVGYHAAVGILEGMLTAGVLNFLRKVRPDLLALEGVGKFRIPDWIGAVLFVAVPAAILVMAGSSTLPDPLEKLLETSPLPPELGSGNIPERLASTLRLEEYLFRAAIFIVLIGLGFLAVRLTRRRRSRL